MSLMMTSNSDMSNVIMNACEFVVGVTLNMNPVNLRDPQKRDSYLKNLEKRNSLRNTV